ncbi:TIGR04282 family arsenosugar biosynthesis glycosyltransferase [Roseivirga sp. E12]|uniref:TIGR04282 family arsenosugar biosynthesis glycosyltransferase n=1 Tax=Roseivirga sp. E12 TaxID=2819237 RepID=UPI001ABC2271|nr:TIGR04282 family arsenosugar biosynthesis glycosyltransferase [Roseivirga sp. E12]MBO3699008.1 TIGR04282 family arsenosugar biosynthesis glycosyltransferase [Roseivirga sp. E12]
MKADLLIIFVKNPILGKAKTRLAATIGDVKALEVYKLLLEKTRLETADLDVDKVVYYSDYVDESDLWDNTTYAKAVQSTGDLGIKITTAFNKAFQDGYQRVCIIGSDCYDMTQNHLEQAFESLKFRDTIIGPAADGGYYTIGMSRYFPELFEQKVWSTETVGSDTIKDFEALDLNYQVLETLNDVDTEDDLGPWAKTVMH